MWSLLTLSRLCFRRDISSAPGSVSQVREATGVLMRLAKEQDIAIFIVGHVTKEGTVAGPRVLEHMVDTVLYFEGDRHASYRILRGVKNRFGSTNEIGVFEMTDKGLREVANPSEYMLSGKPEGASGSVVVCTMEGNPPHVTGSTGAGLQNQFWTAEENSSRNGLQSSEPFHGGTGKKTESSTIRL